MSRWRLDGTGPVATMAVPRARTLAGYDDTGRVVDVVPLGTYGPPHRLVDVATGEEVGRFEVGARTSWVGDGTLALLTESGTMLGHVGSDEPVRPESRSVWRSDWPYPDHDSSTAWAVPDRHPDRLVQFDVRTGATTGQVVRLSGGNPWFVRNTDGGDKLLVSYYTGLSQAELDQSRRFRVQMVDIDDGPVGPDVTGFTAAAPETSGGVGPVVLADVDGGLHEVDPVTLKPLAALPGSVGQVEYLTFSDDGSRLLATSGNRVAQLYDSETWTRVGAVPADSPPTVPQGFLRPDGRRLLTNDRLGVVEWDLDPETMAGAACDLAGRNLSRAEWATYLGDQPYRRTCPQFPAGA